MRWIAALLIVGGFLAFMAYDLSSQGEFECNVCMEFNGRTECRLGSGATRSEAIQAGQTPACQLLASGVTQSFQCSGTPPISVQCTPE
jgi:hypothetical protein